LETKLAIITDIHGNHSALQAVLNDIDQHNPIEHIYCLGDLIAIGHGTNEVLELLFSRDDISFVMGNHDEAILNIMKGKDPGSAGEEREHHQWIASRLDKKFIPALAKIPKQLYAEYNGKKLLFLHYHLNEKNQFLPIEQQPTTKNLDELYQDCDAEIVCFGHHHILHHFKSKNRLYINPGALGCAHKPLAPYAILHIGDNGISVTFKEVAYDNREFLLAYEKLNVPARDFILQAFYGNQHLRFV
jgi:putative phosphoesterase